MDALLLVVAWVVGIASLLLVVDMFVADLSARRAERIAARRTERMPDVRSGRAGHAATNRGHGR